jgi:plastocyanin
VSVLIVDYTFNPTPLEIVAGDTVSWKNTGASPHTVTCDGSAGTVKPVGAPSFDSGIGTPINPGETFQTVLTVPGNYTYLCLYHTGMAGTIVVKPRCQ